MMDFSTAPTEQFNDDLIPEKTLAWAMVHVRPFNLNLQPPIVETPSGADPANHYLDLEFTIMDGRYNKRKVWKKVGVKGGENWVNQGRAGVRAMLEVGRAASVTTNPAGYHIDSYMALDGLKVAIEVGIEKGDAGYRDKNSVKTFLTPNLDAGNSIQAKWQALLKGDCYPAATPATPAAGGQTALPLENKPAWGPTSTGAAGGNPSTAPAGISPSTSPPQTTAPAQPAWLAAVPK